MQDPRHHESHLNAVDICANRGERRLPTSKGVEK